MTRTIIASLTALGIIGAIATTASAHRPKPQAAAEQPFDAARFWQEQSDRSGQ